MRVRTLRWLYLLAVTSGLILITVSPACASEASALTLLHTALEAQGGEAKLRALKSVSWEALGYRNELEESERPEGPYIVEFDTVHEIHDFSTHRIRHTTEAAVYPIFQFSQGSVSDGTVAMAFSGDRKSPSTPEQVKLLAERQALSPERLLLTALDAPDVRREPDAVLQAVPQHVVTFTLDGAPVKIFLNAYTHLPTACDYSGPLARTGYWAFLGDATSRTIYSFWWLAKGGIHLPMQWNIETNGLPDQMLVIRKLQIDEPLVEAELTIPPEVRNAFQSNARQISGEDMPLGDPRRPARELAPGVVLVPGPWNATFIRQDDGIVILEAPISSGYVAKVIEEARKRFPGQPIKAVITTSDSWPHLAGIRECVAQGIPIYALNLNQPILERVIAAHHTARPDTLQRTPKRPVFHLVDGKTLIGTGKNRLEVYPIRGETSERQMMVYFPEHHLLYGSDPFQTNPDGSFFYPQTVSELTDAVAREHLNVEHFFMMHVELKPWAELGKALEAAEKKDTPNGTLE